MLSPAAAYEGSASRAAPTNCRRFTLRPVAAASSIVTAAARIGPASGATRVIARVVGIVARLGCVVVILGGEVLCAGVRAVGVVRTQGIFATLIRRVVIIVDDCFRSG